MSTEWMERAECRKHDPEEWFPVGEGETRVRHSAYALYVCRNVCPVRPECAGYAAAMKRPVGIWAGVDLGDAASKALHEGDLAALTEIAGGVSA